ncbi:MULTISPECIES: hypothetical protein [unclassified Arsukibacterium]|uniref:hypothetical protein n=1 Tax=unclassified Arsukibacterium TaxID=2635278 RepID=UPI000C89E57F|nr:MULTISPECIES: hypothetical protein [unclassified Arsukibacterium]MAA96411.1 GTP-binding protein [Rheinheimera sp.]HAW93168.1 GTP-binding protein [Candidatus Azambacteria bacterium]|tara:strand:- start:21320 stop:21892 length:573 start_codon:yes stop_codon:yes gene_type:complete
MQVYDITDVWMALKLAGKNVFWGLIVILPLCYIFERLHILPYLAAILFAQSILIYIANSRYVIDPVKQVFIFPRSDMENSVFSIITLQPYWNLMRRKTVPLSDIENIYLDTKRWSTSESVVTGNDAKGRTKFKKVNKKHVLFRLNVTGSFGSANLPFLSRQKRDEVRNALEQSIKKASGRRVDSKVAELA